ncbi:MAG: hypothetical protein ACMXYA_02985, partial [Candidatus Woesearchaeota archaeon]
NVTITFFFFFNSNTYQTTFSDAGVHQVTLTADDGKQTTSQTITITVLEVNRPPEFVELADITVTEGDFVEARPVVEDPDGDDVTVTFSRPLDRETGTWQTQVGDADRYIVTATATDGRAVVSQTFQLTVLAQNQPPIITNIGNITVNETDEIRLNPTIIDPDGDNVTVTFSGWMNSSVYQTTFGDAGEHTVTITADDGIDTTSKTITITVLRVNRPPVFRDDIFA